MRVGRAGALRFLGLQIWGRLELAKIDIVRHGHGLMRCLRPTGRPEDRFGSGNCVWQGALDKNSLQIGTPWHGFGSHDASRPGKYANRARVFCPQFGPRSRIISPSLGVPTTDQSRLSLLRIIRPMFGVPSATHDTAFTLIMCKPTLSISPSRDPPACTAVIKARPKRRIWGIAAGKSSGMQSARPATGSAPQPKRSVGTWARHLQKASVPVGPPPFAGRSGQRFERLSDIGCRLDRGG